MTRYFGQHAVALREYNRRRDGSRPLRTFACADCGQSVRGYNGSQLCQLCRWHARHRRQANLNSEPEKSLARQRAIAATVDERLILPITVRAHGLALGSALRAQGLHDRPPDVA
jgi:hypothetical protein